MKIKVGILFGGISREREISFAGGRTVYDMLNKELFEPIPYFMDSLGQIIALNWQYLYKGTIRDFYPPVEFLPSEEYPYQLYAESLADDANHHGKDFVSSVGKSVAWNELPSQVDFMFLCLHGPFGEDGRTQGMLEMLGIPYSGSGIIGSANGIDKALQKELMKAAGFNSPAFCVIDKDQWNSGQQKKFFEEVRKNVGHTMVVKSATQGSSIGVSILKQPGFEQFEKAVDKSFFKQRFPAAEWHLLNSDEERLWIQRLIDIREGIGLPLKFTCGSSQSIISKPTELIHALNQCAAESEIILESLNTEHRVIIEEFIHGREFSCIVIENLESGSEKKVIALPPTEIIKGGDVFDYRSKYLPGLARKVTPINLDQSIIERIASECERLFDVLHCDVYARIDGFITEEGKIFLNDPNTTSGMMPSSFFFHQAAEVGLNPSQFLTFIIRTSILKRIPVSLNAWKTTALLNQLDENISRLQQAANQKTRVAVILGGYSSERHISVESGRNIFEKLSSSTRFLPLPVFLTGSNEQHELFTLPVKLLLKDNADDICHKAKNFDEHPFLKQLKIQTHNITRKYAGDQSIEKPEAIDYEWLKKNIDAVFIALHGRPGEDGAVQRKLDAAGIPYNGSGADSSSVTINKYLTNEILLQQGLLVAKHLLVKECNWNESLLNSIESSIAYPLIAKPVDDGCSSAVRKIKNREELKAFASMIFRKETELPEHEAALLKVKINEEFPQKQEFLIEELISANGAKHFIEITGGLMTRLNDKGETEYEVFEASEALASGEVLSLEEKFLAGEGQNITPARYSGNEQERNQVSAQVKKELEKAARALNVEGYARIDAFVRIYENSRVEVIFIEVNSLPGMTPATCIFHQTALQGYKPYDFIEKILDYGFSRIERKNNLINAG
jgi:UDP-N-acetylmuramate--alanine ligase